jgi:hypothetical protein
MPDVREVYEMVTKQKPPEPGALERQQRRQVRSARNKRMGAFAIAAVIGAVAIVLVLINTPGADRTTPADRAPTAPTVPPVDPQAEEVATGFVEAFGAFDGEQAITYLADNPILEMDASTPEEVPVFTSFLEAMGYEQIPVEPCRVTGSSASGTAVRCPFRWHAIRSDEIGLGPYPGSWDLTVRDGEIVQASLHWNYQEKFSPQMWEPFAEWVRTTYPKDFAVMYTGGGTNFVLSDESTRLWEQRTKEYVKEVQRGNV